MTGRIQFLATCSLLNESWVEIPERLCSKKRYVVQVAGDSLAPTIRKGDHIVCEYHRHRQPGRDIVIMGDFSTLSSGEVAVKRIRETEHAWIFISGNPAYQDIMVKKPERMLLVSGLYERIWADSN
jgi:phage repressor protein C with HTH and peptisase S24 domain